MIDFIIKALNYVIEGLGFVLNIIFSVLPSSPFKAIDNSFIAEYLPTINFFIPVSQIIAIGQAWLLCVGVYYIYQIALRWIKAIE